MKSEQQSIHVGAPTLRLLNLHRSPFELRTMKRRATRPDESPDTCEFWPRLERSSQIYGCKALLKITGGRGATSFDWRYRNMPTTDPPQPPTGCWILTPHFLPPLVIYSPDRLLWSSKNQRATLCRPLSNEHSVWVLSPGELQASEVRNRAAPFDVFYRKRRKLFHSTRRTFRFNLSEGEGGKFYSFNRTQKFTAG